MRRVRHSSILIVALVSMAWPRQAAAQVDFCKRVNQIPIEECRTLEEFYKSTGGSRWKVRGGWFLEDEPCYWWGVSCTTNEWPRHITRLRIIDNNLNGSLPSGLERLTFLRELVLENRVNSRHHGNLTSGIPFEISELEYLEVLRLGRNNFVGSVPVEFANLERLRILDLAENNLTGYIPPLLSSLASLEELDLSRNRLEGPILPSIANMRLLRELRLNDNRLTGSIPESLEALDSLHILDLSNNLLDGSIPESLGNLPLLFSLNLADNQLSGTVPGTFSHLLGLVILDLSGNDLSGAIEGTPSRFLVDLPFCNLSGNDSSLCLAPTGESGSDVVCELADRPDCGSVFGSRVSDFHVSQNGDQVDVTWMLSDPENIKTFIVEDLLSSRVLQTVRMADYTGTTVFETSVGDLPPGGYRFNLSILLDDGSTIRGEPYDFEVLSRDVVLEVYPNPARGGILVNVASQTAGKIRVELVSMSGSRVKLFDYLMPTNGVFSRIPLDLRGLPAGQYHLRIQSESGYAEGTPIIVLGQ